MKRGSFAGRLLRRSTALFLATVGVWALLLCLRAGVPGEGTCSGPADGATGGLSGWQRLVIRQSPLLWAARALAEPMPEAGAEPSPSPEGQPNTDHDDISPQPISTAAPADIVERTLGPGKQGYDRAGGICLYNRSGLPVDLAQVTAAPVALRLPEEGPQVLIVHTHGTEAYTMDGGDIYTPSDANCRTTDPQYNVLRVGDEIQRVFTEQGLRVVHDRTLYDYPKYNGCYTRSRGGVEACLKKYPSVRIVLDIHRDALVGEDGTVYKAATTIDGVKAAQVMLVVGADGGGVHPGWLENLKLAAKLQKSMDTLYPTLARPMTLRKDHYNQHLSPGSLLVEVGCHGNTLQEALAGARLFARAAGQVLLGLQA